MINPVIRTSPDCIEFLARNADHLSRIKTSSFSISGSSYTTVADRIPRLGCQIHL